MEWLRRSGWIIAKTPRLVLSDTGVEFPFLLEMASTLMTLLRNSGWECTTVRPRVNERLYCQIFGRGLIPVHPAIRKMRWCTRATKIEPMDRFKAIHGGLLSLTGVRWGESRVRDEKLLNSGCVAGGECGLPAPGEGKFAAIIDWTTCQVVDWLQGDVAKSVREVMAEFYPVMQGLLDVYDVRKKSGFGLIPPQVKAARFGCIGCPAIDSDKNFKRFLKVHPTWKHLSGIYRMWNQIRKPENRCRPREIGKKPGPIKMEARKRFYAELLRIQNESGIVLVTPEDDAFIRKCWADGVYPRGWSAANE